MAQLTYNGEIIHTIGSIPAVGTIAKGFTLVRKDLSEATLETYAGKRKIINVFPSVDTQVCAESVRNFNEIAAGLRNTVVLNVSADLPFAQQRFCGAENIQNTESLSSFRSSFGTDWGLTIVDSPLRGLLSRAVFVIAPDNRIVYTEQVTEIAVPPNYSRALTALTASL